MKLSLLKLVLKAKVKSLAKLSEHIEKYVHDRHLRYQQRWEKNAHWWAVLSFLLFGSYVVKTEIHSCLAII